ncbi:hypothetical protein CRENBAI_011256 [Crenichthys baileyi]|uniref:Uncharacterized protein n=1 Tax=Crenichthys baileyi TaxID=28760 RepID=A0AAV9R2G1_9TELE
MEWKPRGRCQRVVSLGVIYLLLPKEPVESFWSPVFTRVMFRGLWKLHPRRLRLEPPLCVPTPNPASQEPPQPKL